MLSLVRIFTACCVGLSLLGCGAGVSDATTDTIKADCTLWSIRVTPASANLHPGDTVTVSATVNQCGGYPPSAIVRWRSSDTVTAVVDASGGLVRARASGAATIIATVVADTTIRGAMALVVSPR